MWLLEILEAALFRAFVQQILYSSQWQLKGFIHWSQSNDQQAVIPPETNAPGDSED
jgi:hypothetical protein